MTLLPPLHGRHARDAGPGTPCAERARPWVLAATILASAMTFIDGTVVTIALPAIGDELGASFEALQWVVNAYALCLGALILVGGAAGDRFGRRRVFGLGVALFGIASLACALAPTSAALIGARAVQGVGAALLVPQSLAILSVSFPPAARGRAIGRWAGASAIATALGPPLGGFLVDLLDWRWIFWINLPLAALVVWLTARHVPESRGDDGAVDAVGAGIAVAGFALVTWGTTRLAGEGFALASLAAVVAGVALLGAFVRFESRQAHPLLPLALFRDARFAAANVVTVLLYGALGAVLFLLPFDLIERRGMSPSAVGLSLLPLGLVIGTLSGTIGRVAERVGARAFLVAGPVLVALATLWLAAQVTSVALGVVAPIVLLALGMAFVVAPLTTVVMNAAPDRRAGAASGVNNAASRVAGLLSVTLIGALANGIFRGAVDGSSVAGRAIDRETLRFGELPDPSTPGHALIEHAFSSGWQAGLIAAAFASAAAAWVAWRRIGALPSPTPDARTER